MEIDLTDVDLVTFDAYEAKVLARLPLYGADLVSRERTQDARCEIHILRFPSQAQFQAFLADPLRVAEAKTWADIGAKAKVTTLD